jgi:hypothetical protein
VPLSDVVSLRRLPSKRNLSLKRLKGAAAVEAIAGNIHVRRPAGALGLKRKLFISASHIASSVRVWHLLVPDSIERLSETVEAICSLPVGEP